VAREEAAKCDGEGATLQGRANEAHFKEQRMKVYAERIDSAQKHGWH
jgi:hypothetical protein